MTGLTPGTRYYFIVQTVTYAHANNQNIVESAYSTEASAIAWLQTQVQIAGYSASWRLTTLRCRHVRAARGDGYRCVRRLIMPPVEAGWSGTVMPLLANYTFDPVSRFYSDLAENRLTDNYSATYRTYVLTIISEHGAILKVPDQTAYEPGSSVTVTASPDTGYTFTGWTGDVVSSDNPLVLTMDSNKYLTATYSLNTYTISGTVRFDGSPLGGVFMNGLPGNQVTDVNGAYSGTVIAGSTVLVIPTLEGYVFVPPSITYTSVSGDQHDQDYSATPASVPMITVTSPSGGESWAAGSSHEITWMQTGLTGTVTIDLYKGGVFLKTLGTADVALGTYSWNIDPAEAAGVDYRINISQGAIWDESGTDFSLLGEEVGLRFFVKDTYGYYLWMNTMHHDETFENWQALQGGTSASVASASFDERLYLIAKDALTETLWLQNRDEAGNWSDWTMLGGSLPQRLR